MKKFYLFICCFLISSSVFAAKVKDLAFFEGERTNALVGYGLVVGLDGTGDQTTQAPYTAQSLGTMLTQMGINLPPGVSLQSKNIAAVMITAQLPPFASAGQNIDVLVSSVGNAKSLKGGTLVLSPLKAVDGSIYAMAQGAVVIGTAPAKGQAAQQNVARLPSGGIVEKAAPSLDGQPLVLSLYKADWQQIQKVVDAINESFGRTVAVAADGRKIKILPIGLTTAQLASKILDVNVDLVSGDSKIIINSRTGSVVMGQNVFVSECAISHGTITVSIKGKEGVAQNAASGAAAQTTPLSGAPTLGSVAFVEKQPTLASVVQMLNSLGATPQDIIAIVQAMKEAGALTAQIEVI